MTLSRYLVNNRDSPVIVLDENLSPGLTAAPKEKHGREEVEKHGSKKKIDAARERDEGGGERGEKEGGIDDESRRR